MPRPADPRKQQYWLQHICRWQRSRLTVCDYCDRYQLSQGSFYAWKRTLQQRGVLTDAVPVDGLPPRTDTGVNAPLFVPVVFSAADTTTARIDLVLPDGCTVRVAAGFDAATLRQLLALLRERPC